MDPSGFLCIVVVFIGLGLGGWMLSMGMDKSRITDYVRGRGGRVVSIGYAPFGKGWFGEKNDRIYEVVYYDNSGNQHFATCKTSFWSGVYWTDDRITHRKSRWYDSLTPNNEPGNPLIKQIGDDGSWRDETPPEAPEDEDAFQGSRQAARRNPGSTDITAAGPPEHLVEEVRRLREENERLRRQVEGRGGT